MPGFISFLKIAWAVLSNVPQLIEIVKVVKNEIEESKRDAKIRDNLVKIKDAFKNKDPEALKRILSS